MKRLFILTISIMALLLFAVTKYSFAETCFPASGKLNEDAQNIRLTASEIGWAVGIPMSIVAAAVVEGKVTIFPKGDVEVCLREERGRLEIKCQSLSSDAGIAEWHFIKARKITTTHRFTL